MVIYIRKISAMILLSFSNVHIFEKKVCHLLYADDCNPVAQTESDLPMLMNSLSAAHGEFGLSMKKIVVIHHPVPVQPYHTLTIYIKWKKLDAK